MLQALVTRREQLLEIRLQDLEDEIDKTVRRSDAWRRKSEILRSVPGVGKVLSSMLLAKLPELGTLNRKQVRALVGLASMPDDSGKRHGYRATTGGRWEVRNKLYMSALCAVRANPPLKDLYLRRIGRGKPKKVALLWHTTPPNCRLGHPPE